MLFEKAQLSHKGSALISAQYYHAKKHLIKVIQSQKSITSDWNKTMKGLDKTTWGDSVISGEDELKLPPEFRHEIISTLRSTYRLYKKLVSLEIELLKDGAKSSIVLQGEKSRETARQLLRELNLEYNIRINSSQTVDEWLEASGTPTDPLLKRTTIPIATHWKKTVFDKGLHIALGSKCNILVVRAKEKGSHFLNEEGFAVYEIDGITLHKRKDMTSVRGFVFTNVGGGVEPVFSEDFSKGASLLRRRATRAVFQELDI